MWYHLIDGKYIRVCAKYYDPNDLCTWDPSFGIPATWYCVWINMMITKVNCGFYDREHYSNIACFDSAFNIQRTKLMYIYTCVVCRHYHRHGHVITTKVLHTTNRYGPSQFSTVTSLLIDNTIIILEYTFEGLSTFSSHMYGALDTAALLTTWQQIPSAPVKQFLLRSWATHVCLPLSSPRTPSVSLSFRPRLVGTGRGPRCWCTCWPWWAAEACGTHARQRRNPDHDRYSGEAVTSTDAVGMHWPSIMHERPM